MTTAQASVDVHVPVRMAYDQWTQFEQFPHFMKDVESIQQLDARHLHWAISIAGAHREFDAEISEQIPDQRIAWHTTGGEVQQAGAVSFEQLGPEDTRVTLQMDMEPSGMVEKMGDKLGFVERAVKRDMNNFKSFIESQGAPTGAWRGEVAGQTQQGMPQQGAPQQGMPQQGQVSQEQGSTAPGSAGMGAAGAGAVGAGAAAGSGWGQQPGQEMSQGLAPPPGQQQPDYQSTDQYPPPQPDQQPLAGPPQSGAQQEYDPNEQSAQQASEPQDSQAQWSAQPPSGWHERDSDQQSYGNEQSYGNQPSYGDQQAQSPEGQASTTDKQTPSQQWEQEYRESLASQQTTPAASEQPGGPQQPMASAPGVAQSGMQQHPDLGQPQGQGQQQSSPAAPPQQEWQGQGQQQSSPAAPPQQEWQGQGQQEPAPLDPSQQSEWGQEQPAPGWSDPTKPDDAVSDPPQPDWSQPPPSDRDEGGRR